jgi:hypothetical protein
MLAAAPSTQTKAWTNQLDVELGHARVSYEKVGSWGVRSFYRCGLVEMATLDARAAETVRALAHGGDLPWFVARSRRLARRAKTSLRHALQVKAETMLCVQAARDALHELEH